jgi:uncharacterized phage protein (TIGR01671 family)
MNRKILFRAKNKYPTDETKPKFEWVYGNFVRTKSYGEDYVNSIIKEDCIHYIGGEYSYDGWVEIDENTLGQYIGQKDKNGKKIFEGDIILTELKNRPYSKNAKSKMRVAKVVWVDGINEYSGNNNYNPMFDAWLIDNEHNYGYSNATLFNNCEIIGNICRRF